MQPEKPQPKNDRVARCPWPVDDLYRAYHDQEWGVPLHDDQRLFEFLVLEGAQAGLSWHIILKKRDNRRGCRSPDLLQCMAGLKTIGTGQTPGKSRSRTRDGVEEMCASRRTTRRRPYRSPRRAASPDPRPPHPSDEPERSSATSPATVPSTAPVTSGDLPMESFSDNQLPADVTGIRCELNSTGTAAIAIGTFTNAQAMQSSTAFTGEWTLKVAVVDTQVNHALAKRLVDAIRTTYGKPILFAVNTHYHWDHTSGNAVVEEAILTVRRAIETGRTIVDPLRETGVFPNMVVQMIGVGEQTGALDSMLGKVADFYEDEVDAAVGDLLTAMEPMIILILGVVVGGVVISMYLPLFSLIGKLAG